MPRESPYLRILVVDDDEAFGRLLTSIVSSTGFARAIWVSSGTDALRAAPEADVILLDHQLPDTTGLDLLPALRTLPGQPSVILVTAHGDEALAVRALRAGADDYVIKDASLPGLLPEVLERARRYRALQEALGAAERDLVHAERLAAIGEVNVALHHSINNPLMTAYAETDLLLGATSLTPEHRGSITAIRAALDRIREIVLRLGTLREAQTTEYLDGIAMIDLSRRSRPVPMQLGVALVWFPQDDIARVVSMLLSHAGFQVERVASLPELTTRTERPTVRVVVLAGLAAGASDALGGFRPEATRGYTLVALVPGDGANARKAGADHVVSLPFDPGTFVSDLLGVMRG